MRVGVALPLVWLMILTACGSGNSNAGSNTSLAGNWQLELQQVTGKSTAKTESGFLVQAGNNLSGNLLLTGQTLCPGIGAAQGQVSDSNVSIIVNQIGETVNLTGSLGSKGSLSGSYSILASPCGATQVGTWTGIQVQTLTGSLGGTFTSTKTSGVVFQIAGKIAQAPNTGASSASLSGNMTSTGAPCFSSVSVSGLVSGTSVVFNLLSSEGLAIGQFHGTMTADASTITGPYDFLNQQRSPPPGCEDYGTAVVTVKQ